MNLSNRYYIWYQILIYFCYLKNSKLSHKILILRMMQKKIELFTPANWTHYSLIDCGNFEKLERFGDYITIRPEPQAIWDKKLSDKEWKEKAHVNFIGTSANAGKWD